MSDARLHISPPTPLALGETGLVPGLPRYASVTMRTADEIAVRFKYPGHGDDFGPLGEVVGVFRHDRERGYVPENVELWNYDAGYEWEGGPDALTVANLRDLGDGRASDRDDRRRDEDAASVVALAGALLSRGKSVLDGERRRFVGIERDMRAEEADRMRQGADAAESRRVELERELDPSRLDL